MKTSRQIFFAFMISLIFMLGTSSISAQVLATGETGGKGNQAVLVSAIGLLPDSLELLNVYGQYIYGVTDWLDLGPLYGNISVLGHTQHYIGAGWNLRLLRRSQTFVDVSFFGVATIPLDKRGEASTVFTAPAIVVSRPVLINGKSISFYTGINSNVPFGSTDDKLFTPPDAFWNVPAGFSTAVSEKWLFYAEVDVRTKKVDAVGVGLVRTF